MKNTKSRAGKVLLIAIAAVLVATVSVSFTLAYLTARTEELTNTFTASGDINGEVQEPKFEEDRATGYLPGEEVPKDPLIQNLTTDSGMYVGARLDFYIDVENKGSYQQVSYDKFKEFVTIKYDSSKEFNTGDSDNTDTWKDITGEAESNTNGSKFFMYNKALEKKDNSNDLEEEKKGSYEAGNDSTKPIFTAVTPDKNVTVTDNPEANVTLNNQITSITKDSNIFYTNSDKETKCVFKYFNFKIVVTGFGVKDDATLGANDSAKKSAAKTLILNGLEQS